MSCDLAIADLPTEFAEVSDALFSFWLEIAEAEVDTVAWEAAGLVACAGVKLLVCHYLAEAGEGSSSASEGEVASERVGLVATTFAVSSAATKDHGSTSYGKAFDAMLKRLGGRRRKSPFGVQVVCG